MARLKDEKRRTLSSRTWLERQLSDPYVARAKREGLRSRAAFKLAEIDDKYHVLKEGARVVDLGAAPGGWSEVAVKRIGARGRVIALDILDMKPISGVDILKLDFLDAAAPAQLKATLGDKAKGKVDVVLSDMAANATGHRKTDHLRIMALAEAATAFAREVLAPGGAFLCKVLKAAPRLCCWPSSSAISRASSTSSRRRAAPIPRSFICWRGVFAAAPTGAWTRTHKRFALGCRRRPHQFLILPDPAPGPALVIRMLQGGRQGLSPQPPFRCAGFGMRLRSMGWRQCNSDNQQATVHSFAAPPPAD